MGLSILLLLSQEHAESHVCYLDVAVGSAQNVVRLDIAMKDVARMHGMQAKSDLVQAKLAEVFGEVTLLFDDNFRQVSTLHEFNKDPEAILEVVYFFTFDQLFAVEVRDKTAFVYHIFSFGD